MVRRYEAKDEPEDGRMLLAAWSVKLSIGPFFPQPIRRRKLKIDGRFRKTGARRERGVQEVGEREEGRG